MEGVQKQLGKIQTRQTEFQAACDSILHRLEQLESSRLRSIPEASVSPPGPQTADSVRSLPQPACQSFHSDAGGVGETCAGTSEKEFSHVPHDYSSPGTLSCYSGGPGHCPQGQQSP